MACGVTQSQADCFLERARADLETGRNWRARERLRSYVHQPPFDERLVRMLGELELEAGELPAAGRWLWVIDSQDPSHAAAIALHLRRHDGPGLWRSLPRPLRRGVALPPAVDRELRARGFGVERAFEIERQRATSGRRRPPSLGDWLGLLIAVVLLALLLLGARDVLGWIFAA